MVYSSVSPQIRAPSKHLGLGPALFISDTRLWLSEVDEHEIEIKKYNNKATIYATFDNTSGNQLIGYGLYKVSKLIGVHAISKKMFY